MMISTKGRYALRLMTSLALLGEEYGSVKTVAEAESISVKYLEAIISVLLKADLVESRRGREGGYRLSRPPEEITLLSILKLTEGSISPASCLDHDGVLCGREVHCSAYPLWQRLNSILEEYLDSVTLQDLVSGNI